jgi:hypothetical protein
MRTLAVSENIRADGVIDASDGRFRRSGHEDLDRSDLNEAFRSQAAAAPSLTSSGCLVAR